MSKWLIGEGKHKDVVISSRVRLARNLKGKKFPNLLNKEESDEIIEIIRNVIDCNSFLAKQFKFYRVNELSQLKRRVFVENYLISLGLLEKVDISAFLLRLDEKVTIMINEEDHIRIHILLPGLNLNNGWERINDIDDSLESKLRFAYDEKLGYLTSCPTNVGTGMRSSVMVHLPALVISKQMNRIIQAVNQIGLTVRGFYGEGTNTMGNLFQISNQTTLGQSEEEIIRKLNNIVVQIIDKERAARHKLLNTKRLELEDRVFRSLGILKYAKILTLEESMKLLSNVKLGVDLDIIDNIESITLNELLIDTQSASIKDKFDSDSNQVEINVSRAHLIRSKLCK